MTKLSMVASSFPSHPANTTFSVKLCSSVKNGSRQAWTDPKHLIALSATWPFPSEALPHALSIALAPLMGRGVDHQKSPFWPIFIYTLQLVTPEPTEPSGEKATAPTATNQLQEMPYLSTLLGETWKKHLEGQEVQCPDFWGDFSKF